MEGKLVRSKRDRVLAGVCGGIAQWLGWGSTKVRVLFVVISILSVAFPGILVYLILWVLMPSELLSPLHLPDFRGARV